jgi:YcxB-like protein
LRVSFSSATVGRRYALSVNEDINIRYRWTAEELLNAYRSHFRHRVRPAFRGAFWLLAVVFIIVGALQLWQTGAPFPGGVLFFVGLYIPLMFLVFRPWLVRRQFAKRPDRDADVEWHISAEPIRTQTGHGSSDFTWAALAKVVQTPTGFLFYPTHQIFHWLPRRAFAAEADFDRLAHLAQQKAREFHRSA